MYAFSPENRLVLAACSPNPDSAQLRQAISEIDNWDKASEKLIKKGVAPLFLELLNQHPELVAARSVEHELKNKSTAVEQFDSNVNIQSKEKPVYEGFTSSDRKVPEEAVAKLRQTYLKTMSRSMLLYDAFREIAEALNKRGIKAVALKGIYLAERLYPKIGIRQFSDIDLLVSRDDAGAVVEAMELLGFRMTEPPGPILPSCLRNLVTISTKPFSGAVAGNTMPKKRCEKYWTLQTLCSEHHCRRTQNFNKNHCRTKQERLQVSCLPMQKPD